MQAQHAAVCELLLLRCFKALGACAVCIMAMMANRSASNAG
jgi:hypothetical protein